MKALLLSALVALPFVAQDRAPQEKAPAPADPQQALIDYQKACYPLKTCATCSHELDKSAVPVVVDRKLVMVCSDACKGGVEAKKADVLKQIETGVIEAQKAAYPLEKCPISGEKLGGMGEPVDMVVGMRLVRVCCKGCVPKVEKDAEAVLAKLERAYIASQKVSYGVDVCPISGDKLVEGKAVDVLYGTKLVRLCCNDCKTTMNRTPQRVLNRVENLRAGKPVDPAPADKEKKKDGEKNKGGDKGKDAPRGG